MNTLNKTTIYKTPYTKLVDSEKCDLHSHTFFEFSICLCESYQNVIGGKEYTVKKGDVLLLRPQDCHSFFTKGAHLHRDVYVDVEMMKGICDIIDPALFTKISSEPLAVFFKLSEYNLQLLESKLNLLDKTLEKTPILLQTARANAVTEILTLWQQSVTEKSFAVRAPWLDDLLCRLNRDYYLQKGIEEIAESTHYSHGYVCRAFKKIMGISLKDYVENVKFSYATVMLLNSGNSITDISKKLNYSSPSNFIIAFKRKYGISPLQWRKLQKQNK